MRRLSSGAVGSGEEEAEVMRTPYRGVASMNLRAVELLPALSVSPAYPHRYTPCSG